MLESSISHVLGLTSLHWNVTYKAGVDGPFGVRKDVGDEEVVLAKAMCYSVDGERIHSSVPFSQFPKELNDIWGEQDMLARSMLMCFAHGGAPDVALVGEITQKGLEDNIKMQTNEGEKNMTPASVEACASMIKTMKRKDTFRYMSSAKKLRLDDKSVDEEQ